MRINSLPLIIELEWEGIPMIQKGALESVELGQFILSSRAEDARVRAYEGLVILGLIIDPQEGGKTARDIRRTISYQCNFQSFPSILLEPVLISMEEQGILITVSTKDEKRYQLSSRTSDSVEKLLNKNKESMKSIYYSLFNNIEGEFGKTTKFQKREIETAFDSYIGLTIGSSIELASAIFNKSTDIDLEFETKIEQATEIISNPHLRNVFQDTLKEMLINPSDEFKDLLFNSATTALFIKVINVDPKLQRFENKLLNRISIYLDTNIIISLLQPNHLRHKEVKRLISISNSFGIQLKFSNASRKEFYSSIKTAESIYKKESTSRTRKMKSGNAFVDYYLRRKEEGSTESWNIYISTLKNSEEKMGEEFNIYNDSFDYPMFLDEIKEDDQYKSLFNYIQLKVAEHGYWKGTNVINHDAVHLAMIQKIRGEEPFSSPWFLTLDHSLSRVDEDLLIHYTPYSKFPSSIDCDSWVQFLIPFIGPTHYSKNIEDIFCAFMASHFFVVSQTIDTNYLYQLIKPIIDDISTIDDDDIQSIIQSSYVQKVLSDYEGKKESEMDTDTFRVAVVNSIDKLHEEKLQLLENEQQEIQTSLSELKEKSEDEKRKIEDLEIIKEQKQKEIIYVMNEKKTILMEKEKLQQEKELLQKEKDQVKRDREEISKRYSSILNQIFPHRIIQISDLHFGVEDKEIYSQFIKDLKQTYNNDIKQIIITGDLTNMGYKYQFKRANGFITTLSHEIKIGLDSIIILPGNHDMALAVN